MTPAPTPTHVAASKPSLVRVLTSLLVTNEPAYEVLSVTEVAVS